MNLPYCAKIHSYPQVDLVTGLAIEEACYAQVCNMVIQSGHDNYKGFCFCVHSHPWGWVHLRFCRDALLHADGLCGLLAIPGIFEPTIFTEKENRMII